MSDQRVEIWIGQRDWPQPVWPVGQLVLDSEQLVKILRVKYFFFTQEVDDKVLKMFCEG